MCNMSIIHNNTYSSVTLFLHLNSLRLSTMDGTKRLLQIIWTLCQHILNRRGQQFTVGDLSCHAASSVDSITDYNWSYSIFCHIAQRRSSLVQTRCKSPSPVVLSHQNPLTKLFWTFFTCKLYLICFTPYLTRSLEKAMDRSNFMDRFVC